MFSGKRAFVAVKGTIFSKTLTYSFSLMVAVNICKIWKGLVK